MQRRSVFLAAVAFALPVAAQAQPVTGLYIGTGAGLNIMQDETDASSNGVATPGKSLQFNVGATGVGSVGWGFGNGLRAELEFDYRYNALNGASVGGVHSSLSGREQKYGPMVNVLYDFNGISSVFVPYLGLGVGYQWASVSGTGALVPAAPAVLGAGGVVVTRTVGSLVTGTAGAFAYQAILGAALPIAAVPGLAVTAEYRFMGLAGNRSYTGNALGNAIVRTDDFNHSILVGLRYNFGVAPAPAPAPAPMAAPAPEPARSYLVFFDWDKATLTTRAQQIIREAADNSTKVKYTQIQVNGYTDTSGTPQYNQGLSIRRAQAVAAELVKDGVPQGSISIQGFGETHLLVPTGPGVREPQNRRVEIVIR
jgi:outer membrane protein OmpA-like peptidoglycan-associated protein